MQHHSETTAALAGLAPGEVRASNANSLTPAARSTLLAIATAGRARAKRRAWFADGHPRPILNGTIASLRARGLVTGKCRTTCSLTPIGDWYARTIVTDLANHNSTGEATLCNIEF